MTIFLFNTPKYILTYFILFISSINSLSSNQPFNVKHGYLSYNYYIAKNPSHLFKKQDEFELFFFDYGNVLGMETKEGFSLLVNRVFQTKKQPLKSDIAFLVEQAFYSKILNDTLFNWKKGHHTIKSYDNNEITEFYCKIDTFNPFFKDVSCYGRYSRNIPIYIEVNATNSYGEKIKTYITRTRVIYENKDQFKRYIKRSKKSHKKQKW